MVKIIPAPDGRGSLNEVERQKDNRELYQCEECGFQYADDSTSLITGKEWAEKCEAWRKEHQSCNIEIIAHGTPPEDSPKDSESFNEEDRKFPTKLFYGLIGFSASLAFFIALYWSLRLNASINNLIQNFIGTPLYFWPYVIMTLAAIILFGVSVALFIYRWRKWGFALRSSASWRSEGGAATGSIISIAASACPVCGSTILSAIGIAGGLTAFPLGGLELKALSLGLLALPIWLMKKDIKRLESDCANGVCPSPQDPSLKENEKHWLVGILVLIVILVQVAWGMLKTDPALARIFANNILNPNDNALYSASISETGNKVLELTSECGV